MLEMAREGRSTYRDGLKVGGLAGREVADLDCIVALVTGTGRRYQREREHSLY
jgi:hypothetical protein